MCGQDRLIVKRTRDPAAVAFVLGPHVSRGFAAGERQIRSLKQQLNAAGIAARGRPVRPGLKPDRASALEGARSGDPAVEARIVFARSKAEQISDLLPAWPAVVRCSLNVVWFGVWVIRVWYWPTV